MKRLIVAIRNMWLTLFLMLIIGIRLFADPVESRSWEQSDSETTSESGSTSEIQNSLAYYLQAIEMTICTLTFTEAHRLLAVLILSNRFLPISYNFNCTILSPSVIKYSSPIPIFIKGHALLN